MKILLSPAKSLLEKVNLPDLEFETPQLLEKAELLANELKTLTSLELQKLMKLSMPLADLNHMRYQNWSTPFHIKNSIPAGWIFAGEAYRGLDYNTFDNIDIEFSQSSLRILSGLYGVLRPLDLIQPYRLEMGTKIKLSNNVKNLYDFWGSDITQTLNEETETNEIIVNLASNEYFKAIKTNKLKGKLISCIFKEDKGGEYKIIMSYAKRARGMMSRYIIKEKIDTIDGLISFNMDGYNYNSNLSNENELVFIR